jgi:hypothetical protein
MVYAEHDDGGSGQAPIPISPSPDPTFSSSPTITNSSRSSSVELCSYYRFLFWKLLRRRHVPFQISSHLVKVSNTYLTLTQSSSSGIPVSAQFRLSLTSFPHTLHSCSHLSFSELLKFCSLLSLSLSITVLPHFGLIMMGQTSRW